MTENSGNSRRDTSVSIRKGDQVRVMAGRDKGKTGRVLSVDPRQAQVTVEHANMIKRHTRPTRRRTSRAAFWKKKGRSRSPTCC